MIDFCSDYTEGAHPRILDKLLETNLEQTAGYGMDDYCRQAASLIRAACEAPDADVHFLTGGTQANLTVIAAALRPHQGVIAVDSGHITTHESGAIEATGHKVIALPHSNGKLDAAAIAEVAIGHRDDENREHTVQPKMVYISNPTELGTIYSLNELEIISKTCREHGLLLYVDGARLGYALAAEGNDIGLADLSRLCDAFTIGGTKVGALFGEAVVLINPALQTDFRYIIKQRGAMLAKGRLLGLQFLTLFEDGLYDTIGHHAIRLALEIRTALASKGYPFLIDSPTNQQFPILPDSLIEQLGDEFKFIWWQRVDPSHSAVRFCTSWATKEENVDKLIRYIFQFD